MLAPAKLISSATRMFPTQKLARTHVPVNLGQYRAFSQAQARSRYAGIEGATRTTTNEQGKAATKSKAITRISGPIR